MENIGCCLLWRELLNRNIGRKGGIYEADSNHNRGKQGHRPCHCAPFRVGWISGCHFATKPRESCQEQLKLLEEDEIDFIMSRELLITGRTENGW